MIMPERHPYRCRSGRCLRLFLFDPGFLAGKDVIEVMPGGDHLFLLEPQITLSATEHMWAM